MLVESSIAATFVECLKVVSNCSFFPIVGAQTSFKAGGCVFSCLECRKYNTPFIWLFFLLNFLNFAFAFKISGNSNLSPHIRWTSNSLHHYVRPACLMNACFRVKRMAPPSPMVVFVSLTLRQLSPPGTELHHLLWWTSAIWRFGRVWGDLGNQGNYATSATRRYAMLIVQML